MTGSCITFLPIYFSYQQENTFIKDYLVAGKVSRKAGETDNLA